MPRFAGTPAPSSAQQVIDIFDPEAPDATPIKPRFGGTAVSTKPRFGGTPAPAEAPKPRFAQPAADESPSFGSTLKRRFGEAAEALTNPMGPDYKPAKPEKGESAGQFVRRAAKQDIPAMVAAPLRMAGGAAGMVAAPIGAAAETVERKAAKAAGVPPEKLDKLAKDTGDVSEALLSVVPGGRFEKIAAAAKRSPEGVISAGAKHADIPGTGQEGFVTPSGRFVTREQALPMAKANKQVVKELTESGKLHSEDIGRPAPSQELIAKLAAPKKPPGIIAKADRTVKTAFAPAAVSKEAERVAAIKREQLGVAARDTAASAAQLERHADRFDKLTPEEQVAFPRYMENFSNPAKQPTLAEDLKAAAADMRAAYKFRADKIRATKSLKDTNLVEDYLDRNFTFDNPDRKAAFYKSLGGKQGKGGFTRARKYPTYEEALTAARAAGGKPAEENFIKGANRYYANADMFVAHNRAIDAMRKEGLWKYGRPGRAPEGWEPLKGRAAFKVGVDKKSGQPIQLQAYAPADAARVYNNYISAGLGGEAGKVMQTAQRAFNAITMLKLGLSSTWHAGVTGTAAISSDLARVTRQAKKAAKDTTPEQLARGIAKTGTELLKSESGVSKPGELFSPYRVAREGSKFHKQYLRLTDYGPDVEKLVDVATKANVLQGKRPEYMNAVGPRTFKQVFKASKTPYGGALNVFAHGFGSAMQKISAPMFDKWIPDMKRGVILERLQQWVAEHPEATYQDQVAYARKLGDSVDNRFGEMMRDNLFWNRTLRDAMQFGLLSYSWVAGATRMAAGAVKETAQTLRTGEELGPNAEYLIANAITSAALGSVYQYLHTGTLPQQPSEAFFPKTGGVQYVGKGPVPEQAVLPSGHWAQYAHYMHDPLGELYNEGNIGAKVLYDALRNKDYREMPIAKPWAAWSPNYLKEVPDAVWRYFNYISQQAVTPISVQSYFNRNKGTGITPAETLMGARPAPSFVTAPENIENIERKVSTTDWKKKLKSDARLKSRRENPALEP